MLDGDDIVVKHVVLCGQYRTCAYKARLHPALASRVFKLSIPWTSDLGLQICRHSCEGTTQH